jgi:hypothetical protein
LLELSKDFVLKRVPGVKLQHFVVNTRQKAVRDVSDILQLFQRETDLIEVAVGIETQTGQFKGGL